MFAGLTMDHALQTRSVWSSDTKFLQHPTDLNTSVVVTRCIPAGTCFGPCVLQNTFYETIAFIAQKCSDKTAKSYMFRVDPEAMHNSALVLSWLRLVQAARNAEEQNAEAFLKAGQVYVRTTRDIQSEEELLVWYDQELSDLLGFTDMIKGLDGEYKCGRCNQIFKNQNPFVAHCRFLCTQSKSDTWNREVYELKHVETKRHHRVTDFHNIARDLERKISGGSDEAETPSRKRKGEDAPVPKWRKTVLLEKTNISNDENVTQMGKSCDQAADDSSSSPDKLKADRVKAVRAPRGSADSAEVGEVSAAFTHHKVLDTRLGTGEGSGVLSSGNSAFSLVLSSSQGEQKSAFCKPYKRTSAVNQQIQLSSAPTAPPSRVDEITDAFTNRTILGYNNLMASSIVGGDMQTLASPIPLGNAFHYAPEHWSRSLHTTSALTVLPPTFTSSFGVSVQNWCAKCNLSFRMTSDLVFHMRSHHKKEFAAESQVRRRKEEKLTCPICHEYFRERHHLSRHMTSHN
ncbi:zinc finger protein 488 isoform X1 [Xiphophorus hellerii]|uniref:zinc finger protein 488 isoform X1 n=2 Tax=Xiphophorus hellerii TaxID=8084 RepID=UPI0013B3CAD7|nr:PR domain zinc finger protein 8-like isoform X1 [Xiphophorus hellerii]